MTDITQLDCTTCSHSEVCPHRETFMQIVNDHSKLMLYMGSDGDGDSNDGKWNIKVEHRYMNGPALEKMYDDLLSRGYLGCGPCFTPAFAGCPAIRHPFDSPIYARYPHGAGYIEPLCRGARDMSGRPLPFIAPPASPRTNEYHAKPYTHSPHNHWGCHSCHYAEQCRDTNAKHSNYGEIGGTVYSTFAVTYVRVKQGTSAEPTLVNISDIIMPSGLAKNYKRSESPRLNPEIFSIKSEEDSIVIYYEYAGEPVEIVPTEPADPDMQWATLEDLKRDGRVRKVVFFSGLDTAIQPARCTGPLDVVRSFTIDSVEVGSINRLDGTKPISIGDSIPRNIEVNPTGTVEEVVWGDIVTFTLTLNGGYYVDVVATALMSGLVPSVLTQSSKVGYDDEGYLTMQFKLKVTKDINFRFMLHPVEYSTNHDYIVHHITKFWSSELKWGAEDHYVTGGSLEQLPIQPRCFSYLTIPITDGIPYSGDLPWGAVERLNHFKHIGYTYDADAWKEGKQMALIENPADEKLRNPIIWTSGGAPECLPHGSPYAVWQFVVDDAINAFIDEMEACVDAEDPHFSNINKHRDETVAVWLRDDESIRVGPALTCSATATMSYYPGCYAEFVEWLTECMDDVYASEIFVLPFPIDHIELSNPKIIEHNGGAIVDGVVYFIVDDVPTCKPGSQFAKTWEKFSPTSDTDDNATNVIFGVPLSELTFSKWLDSIDDDWTPAQLPLFVVKAVRDIRGLQPNEQRFVPLLITAQILPQMTHLTWIYKGGTSPIDHRDVTMADYRLSNIFPEDAEHIGVEIDDNPMLPGRIVKLVGPKEPAYYLDSKADVVYEQVVRVNATYHNPAAHDRQMSQQYSVNFQHGIVIDLTPPEDAVASYIALHELAKEDSDEKVDTWILLTRTDEKELFIEEGTAFNDKVSFKLDREENSMLQLTLQNVDRDIVVVVDYIDKKYAKPVTCERCAGYVDMTKYEHITWTPSCKLYEP